MANICYLDSVKNAWDIIEKTHENDFNSSKDKLSCSEDDSSSTNRVILAFADLPNESEDESCSDDDGDENVENIQDAFNKL